MYIYKVKWSRYRPGVAQRVGRGIALLFHDRDTRRGWVVSSTPRPHFTPEKNPVPIIQEAGWAPGPVWTGGKSRPHRDSIPDRPASSQSLYQLSYLAHIHIIYIYIYLYTHLYIYIVRQKCYQLEIQLYWNIELHLMYPYLCWIAINCEASLRSNFDSFVLPEGYYVGLMPIRISRNWSFQGPIRKGSRATRCSPPVQII